MTVLGGWLGAGKTTLLNRLLGAADRRIAVVVNDIGEVNVDAGLIEAADDEVIELTNGCVCCAIGGSLAITLKDLSERRPRPHHIVVEASGIADPGQVARYGDRRIVPLDAIVTVADATDVIERIEDPVYGPLARRQLMAADVVVMTKTDLLDAAPPDLGVVTGAPVTTCENDADVVGLLTVGAPERSPSQQAPSGDRPTPGFVTETVAVPAGAGADAVAAVLATHPGLLRAKAVVATKAGSVAVHLAGRRVTVDPTTAAPTPLVLIGHDAGCVADAVAALRSIGSDQSSSATR